MSKGVATIGIVFTAVLLGTTSAALARGEAERSLIKRFAQDYCSGPLLRPPQAGARLLDKHQFRTPPARRGGRPGQGRKAVWDIGDDRQLHLTRLRMPRGPLTFVDLFTGAGDALPSLRGVVSGNCRIVGGREIVYGSGPQPLHIKHLDRNLQPTGKRLAVNEPTPRGEARSCVKVGVLDNGVNYTLPELRRKMAFDSQGKMLGLDVWENDNRPFDYGYNAKAHNPMRSAFNPNRHGTMVASVVAQYGSENTCLVPVRYPPFDRGDAVSRAIAYFAKNDVRIVTVQSGRTAPWPQFEQAMKDNPQILFVVAAGNNGVALERRPFYPASYNLPNMLVVKGLDGTGKRWRRSNQKVKGNVVAVQATDVPVTLYNGQRRKLSGTSFAAPKIAGFAAKLMGEERITGSALLQRVLAASDGQNNPFLSEAILGRKDRR